MKRIAFRQRLFVVVAAAVVPLATMSAVALYAGYQQQRAQAERAGLDLARALSIAVDGELRRTVSVLQVLDDALEADHENLQAFHEHARRVRQSQRHWRAISLYDAAGNPVLNTEIAFGQRPRGVIEAESLAQVVKTHAPVVGFLTKGPQGLYAFPVRVPVMRGDQLKYVITAVIEPAAILEVLHAQRVPQDWVVGVADAKGIRVARTRSAEQSLGTPYSPSLVELMRTAGDEGKGPTYSTEGDAVFTAYTRARGTGWYTAVGLPRALVEGTARQSFGTWGGGLALSLIVGLVFALLLARNVTRPMERLRLSALASKDGRDFAPTGSDIREIDDVASALAEAAKVRSEALQSERAARASAETANRAKDEFLAMLGHELRNPLGAISNAATLLDAPRLPPESAARARSVITRQVSHLTRLMDDLLDVGRALMGKIQLRRQPLDLAALVAQCVATLNSSHRLGGHRLIESYEQVWIDADPIRMDQIISNLLVNACKYTPTGGTIHVRVVRTGDHAEFRVADDGIGLEPELAARVFDLFVQGERDLDRSQGGLGIGLTLVRRLAELHGGSASVHSDGPGKGSEFTVRLHAIDAPERVEAEPGPAKTVGRHILVVEDNIDSCETMRALLEAHGHRVEAATDGVTGLERALAVHPEVILLDVGLPRMDGYEVARRIRASNGARRPFIIAVTGYGAPEDRERALESGFDAHVTKPVEYSTLVALFRSPPAT
ncbi:MAG TPA: ATP-binding protein [Usitatibacter sp.]|nr:ATP-binding protein [Usitatibacter sp.]